MQESLLQWLAQLNLFHVIFIIIAIEIAIAILGLVPSFFITVVNVAILGPFYGFVVSLFGEVVGAQIAFYLYRYGLKKPIQVKMSAKLYERLFAQRNAISLSIILQGRLLPFVPSGVVTFYGAVSTIAASSFFIASSIGKIPAVLLEALVAYGVLQSSHSIAVLLSLALVFLFFFIRGIVRSRH